jgi:hypothetical protein
MLGKASEITTVEIRYFTLNQWLRDHPECEIIDIKYAFAPSMDSFNGGGSYALIIYKEQTS